MIEVNAIKTNIPIPRSAIPSGCDISNLGATIYSEDADNSISSSKTLEITIPTGHLNTNYIYVNTGNTFNNIPNNEPAFYYLILYNRTNINEILYTVPIRWCGRLNGTTTTVQSNNETYADMTKSTPIKYFEL